MVLATGADWRNGDSDRGALVRRKRRAGLEDRPLTTRGRRRGSFSTKLVQAAGDIIWDQQFVIEHLIGNGTVPTTANTIRRLLNNKSEMARALHKHFPERYPSVEATRKLLHKEYLHKKLHEEREELRRRILARILGEE
jgi:hypothetical protein